MTDHALALLTGGWAARAVTAAVRLGVVDVLAEGPADGAAIATRLGLHEPTLARLLRVLVDRPDVTAQARAALAAAGVADRVRVVGGGRERDEAEYAALLAETGLVARPAAALPMGFSVVAADVQIERNQP